jgi:hypothetical protein
MQRRQILKQIGAASTVAVGAVGAASAQRPGQISLSEANYVTVEIGGESRDLTLEEYDQHPKTGSLADLDTESTCCYECKECCYACCDDACCWGQECGSCPGC